MYNGTYTLKQSVMFSVKPYFNSRLCPLLSMCSRGNDPPRSALVLHLIITSVIIATVNVFVITVFHRRLHPVSNCYGYMPSNKAMNP